VIVYPSFSSIRARHNNSGGRFREIRGIWNHVGYPVCVIFIVIIWDETISSDEILSDRLRFSNVTHASLKTPMFSRERRFRHLDHTVYTSDGLLFFFYRRRPARMEIVCLTARLIYLFSHHRPFVLFFSIRCGSKTAGRNGEKPNGWKKNRENGKNTTGPDRYRNSWTIWLRKCNARRPQKYVTPQQ